MISIQFQPFSEEYIPQTIFAITYAVSQITNLVALFFLPHLQMIIFKIAFIFTLISSITTAKNSHFSLLKKILDFYGLIEVVNIFKNQGTAIIKFTELKEDSSDILKVRTLLPFLSLWINYHFIINNEIVNSVNYYKYLIAICLSLNLVIISCIYNFQLSGKNSYYFYDQHLLIILSIFSHFGLAYLCLLQNNLGLLLIIRTISLSVQYITIAMNKKHPCFQSTFTTLALNNLQFYPQNYGPFFKLGYYKYGQINYDRLDEVTKTHSFQSLFFLRVEVYLEMLVFLIINIASQKDLEGFFILQIVIYTLFSFYSIITLPYFIKQFYQIFKNKCEYLTLKYSTPKEAIQLLNNSNSIIYLCVETITQEQQIQNRNYQRLACHDSQYQNLIEKLFQFVYQEERQIISQRIEIEGLFSLRQSYIQLNAHAFLLSYLNHVRESKIPQKKKIIFTNCKKMLINYQLNQALFDRLFKFGFYEQFFKVQSETFSTQFITNQYLSFQLKMVAFKKFIQPYMVMNPVQLSYDLFE